MEIIFAEYKVSQEYREQYFAVMDQLKRTHPELSLYEGSGQPGLFVEVWEGQSKAAYILMKKERETASVGHWAEINICITGGTGKLHIWHFRQI